MHSLNVPSSSAGPSNLVSRKRQRSMSMDSATSSSSPKRAASEDPSASAQHPSPHMQNIPLSDPSATEIDAYMATQDMDTQQSVPTPPLSTDQPIATAPALPPQPELSPEEKFEFVRENRQRPMRDGEAWYLVSRQWFRRWQKAMTGEQDKDGAVDVHDLGPVNNAPLLDSHGQLSRSLIEGVDVEYVPENVWELFKSWYGEPQHTLRRNIITRGLSQQTSIELYPPRLRVFRLVDDPESVETSGITEYTTTSSSARRVKDLLLDLASTIEPLSTEEYRVWRVEGTGLSGSDYPLGKLIQQTAEILESSDKTLADAMIESDDAFVVEFAKEGVWIVDEAKRAVITGKLVEDVPPPLFSQENDFFSKLGKSTSSSTALDSTSVVVNGVLSSGVPASSTLLKPALPVATTAPRKPTNEPGTLGLGNMGNTCFMNSALQCLAHTPELSEYFLTGVFQEELNRDNPLGMQGAIAESFGALLRRIWSPTSTSTSYPPRDFKSALQRFAPQFSGYQQQDSQELVAFLLDGLHEDLNRVLKKPYVEKPDWEGGGDVELVKLARESWEGYMKRNDSVIVDLFQGQYRSTLICPECQKVSITFDPFMYLTLPLPVQKKWRHTILYIPWDLDKPAIQVPVEINRDASFKDLRNLLARWMGTESDNLLTVELFSNRVYKNLDDTLLCGEMADGDVIACYELPTHAQQARSYAAKKTDNDPFIIPVFMNEASPTTRHSFARSPSPFGQPFFIAVSQEDARSLERIQRIVIEHLQRWTAHARDLWSWEADDASMEEVQIPLAAPPVPDAVIEIQENGDVVTVEEGDISDMKSTVLDDDDDDAAAVEPPGLRCVGPKAGVFALRLQSNTKDFGAGFGGYGSHGQKYETWESRQEAAGADGALLRAHDALFLEFDENTKAYYFGDDASRWEHARWEAGAWDTFTHPEYEAALRAGAAKREAGITLRDCLDEFTREEQLGEDDLWYCPRCKKHQQATKKFDVWSMPDVLVVHLKRFSSSRALRDKIETFVDFPVQGLDLTDMAQERLVAKALQEQGVDVSAMGLDDLDEPLVYDLYAVDEHLGGLGGGHYRAYSYNHVTEQWYHFDDSFVTPSRPEAAVNANAYLLFYKRRSSKPLGGKTYAKIQAARSQSVEDDATETPVSINISSQIPTPPEELRPSNPSQLGSLEDLTSIISNDKLGRWATPPSESASQSSSPPPLDDQLPSYMEVLPEGAADMFQTASQNIDFLEPAWKASPTSSNEVELDSDDEGRAARTAQWEHSNGLGMTGVEPLDAAGRWMSSQLTENAREEDYEKAAARLRGEMLGPENLSRTPPPGANNGLKGIVDLPLPNP